MGNQGSASSSLRRGTEIIRAGALGQIREIYEWLITNIDNNDQQAPDKPAVEFHFFRFLLSFGHAARERAKCSRASPPMP